MKPNARILAPLGKATGEKLLTRVSDQINRLGSMISGRSVTNLVCQLAAGLYWTAGKHEVVEQSYASPATHPRVGKDDPTRRLYDQVKRAEPEVVCRRTLDAWAAGVLLGCADEGWINLPQRVGNQKQPKPTELTQLRKIRWRQLRLLAEKYRSMEKLRAALHPPAGNTDDKVYKALTRAINTLQGAAAIPIHCLPLLARLNELVAQALAAQSTLDNGYVARRNGKPQHAGAVDGARSNCNPPEPRTVHGKDKMLKKERKQI